MENHIGMMILEKHSKLRQRKKQLELVACVGLDMYSECKIIGYQREYYLQKFPGTRGRGRPRRRFIDSIKSDLEVRGLGLDNHTVSLAQDRARWRMVIHN